MSKFDLYRVRFSAIVYGFANYAIPKGEKFRDYFDKDSADIEWDMSTLRDIESHEYYEEGDWDDPDCSDGCSVEDADGPDARAPYPRTDDDTAPDNDDCPF